MRKLFEIAQDIKEHLSTSFATIRISAAENSPQLLNEIRAMSPGKLPGVVIVFSGGQILDNARVEELKVTLILIDRFVAGSDAKAQSVLQALQQLQELFPGDCIELNGAIYQQLQFYPASADPQYACFALELEVKQTTY